MAGRKPPSGIETVFAQQPENYFFGADTFANDLYMQDLEEAMQDRERNYAANVSVGGLYGLAGPGSGAKLAELEAAKKSPANLLRGISAEGGFDQTEVDAVTALINSNAVTIDQVADQFGLPASVIQAAYDANKPLGGTQGAYDAIVQASAITDTAGEFLEDIAAANAAVVTAQTTGVNPNLSYQEGIDQKITNISNAKTAAQAATEAALASGVIDQGDIDDAFGSTTTENILAGVGNVLGAGTRGIYNVASNIPVVGGYLGDAIEGTADWFKNTKGRSLSDLFL